MRNWTRYLIGFAAACALCAASALAAEFSDVQWDNYFYDPVAWAVGRGITNGTSESAFSPHSPCTNAQILTFLWRAEGSPVVNISNPFSDISSGVFYQAALWSYATGLKSGTLWNGNQPCSRAQAVYYMWALAGRPDAGINRFTDVPADAYYDKAVSWAVQKGVTSGTTQNTFSPDNICSRAQIVTFLFRAHTITKERAYEIAAEHWDYTPGDVARMGEDEDDQTEGEYYQTEYELFLGSDGLVISETTGRAYYWFRMRWLVDDGDGRKHLSTIDMLWIDAETGEIQEGYDRP